MQAALEETKGQLAAAHAALADGESRMLELESNLAKHKAAYKVGALSHDDLWS